MMDLLEDPEIKEKYEKCKYIVKLWEVKFKKKHKRMPSKMDIREADSTVRNAYKKYFQLKTAALEQSFLDVDGFETESVTTSNQEDSFDVPNVSFGHQEDSISKECSVEDRIPEVRDEVWGDHLNNKKKEEEAKSTKERKETTKLNLNITKKLFCGSKLTKRNPRKSLSFSQRNKSDSNFDKQFSLSQPVSTSDHTDLIQEKLDSFASQKETLFQNSSFQIKIQDEKIIAQPVNVIRSILDTNFDKPLKVVDTGWLERLTKSTGVSIVNPDLSSSISLPIVQDVPVQKYENTDTECTKLDYNSEDIIIDSDDETNYRDMTSLHISKKRKIDGNLQTFSSTSVPCAKNLISEANVSAIKTNVDHRNISELNPISEPNPIPTSDSTNELSHNKDASDTNTDILKVSDDKKDKLKKPRKPRKNAGLKKKTGNKLQASKIADENKTTKPRRSSRQTKVKVSLQELSSDEDVFHTDDEDPEYDLEQDKPKASFVFNDLDTTEPDVKTEVNKKVKKGRVSGISKSGSKKNTKKVEISEEESSDMRSYDLEFSVKPRVVAPRYNSIKNVLMEKQTSKIKITKPEGTESTDSISAIKSKAQQAKENLDKKIASGNLNDNFVRINIKKKVFVRGKSRQSFSKYKKAQYKSHKAKALCGPDMDMRGCDGGMLTCFNCGQIGHFAQHCKATKGDGLLSLEAANTEEECPYPTLEEASQMAQESLMKIRKPKLVLKESNSDNGQGNVQGNEGMGSVIECEQDEDVFSDAFDMEELLEETEKLEEYVKKLDVSMYMDKLNIVEPYYKLKEDGGVIETPSEVYEALQKFGHSSFRPGQEQAVIRILSGKSTLVTLSTGSGKSLCYQLPAYLYSKRERCISLIISPLVSLMDDQVTNIAKFMKAGCLHSNQTKSQREKILEAMSAGELSVLLVSPEAVVAGERQSGFGSFLRKLPPIAFACIDEAHCVSQWSHNFRPSYLMICRVLRESLGVQTILGLTATATRATRDSIIKHLEIPDGENGVISDIPLPDNLTLTVSKDLMRDQALVGLLTSERFADCKSIIIYCTRRDECERIAALLRTCFKEVQPTSTTSKKRKRVNLQAEPYHAGLSASRRRTIQNTFMSGELRIVVATVAFGMGINKSDIRAVIHFNMPSSFESYVQEVGRAGRDGLKAHCHVFLDSQGNDECELRRHVHANSIDRHAIRKLLQKIFIPCSCTGVCAKHEVAFSIESTVRELDIPEENISTLLCYLELHKNKYIQLLSPAYTYCKIISYGGPLQIRKVAKECPPLAMALALHKNKEGSDPNVLEFPVIDVAAAIGWDSGICKHKLKNLEWTVVNHQSSRSMISVQFSNLGFRLLAPGNLSDDQLDEALDSLYNRVCDQEKKALLQLHAVHETLREVAQRSYSACVSENDQESTIKLKIREYFSSPDPLKSIENIEEKKVNEEPLVADIHSIISMYRDNSFTGKAIARIFHGIQSPNYPAVVWGRCKFWRSHLGTNFHTIVKIATREIIRTR